MLAALIFIIVLYIGGDIQPALAGVIVIGLVAIDRLLCAMIRKACE